MYKLIQRIHMYLGLLAWSSLLVFGVAGLTGSFRDVLRGSRGEQTLRFENCAIPPNLSDKEVVKVVWNVLALPLTAPESMFGLRRDQDNNLTFTFYFENGISNITILEKEDRVRIETYRNNLWEYFDNLHQTTVNAAIPDWRIRLWTYYNEFAIWTLMAMTLSGSCLWFMSRPGNRVAQVVLVASCGVFAVLYMLSK